MDRLHREAKELSLLSKHKKWAFFISGRGSNMVALLDHLSELDVRLIISNRRAADGLGKARRRGIPTLHFSKDKSWEDLSQNLIDIGVNAIFLVGFMKIIPESFIREWSGQILNVHPSLLPSYPGLNSIERAFEENKPMGVTIHEVTEDVDAGKIIIQKQLVTAPQNSGLSLNELEFEIHLIEHQLVREAAKKWIPKPISS